MLTLDQLIAEAIALPDADKTILIEKLMESMAEQLDSDVLLEGVQKAQARLTEIDNGTVQTIPPGTLTGLCGIAKQPGAAPSDEELQADYTDYLTQKYQ